MFLFINQIKKKTEVKIKLWNGSYL